MNTPFKAINKWAEDDRPREKLISKGKNSLSDAELLAIIIGSGSRNESAVRLSQRILDSVNNNLFALSRLGINDLCRFRGIGEAKAVSLIAAMEIGTRQSSSTPEERAKIRSSRDAHNILITQFEEPHVEEFHLVCLNRANEVISKHFLSRGGMTGTVVDIRIIARLALEKRATGVIISHNHPSGQLIASAADREITRRVKEGLALFDIELIDHMILGGNGYYSFKDSGIL